jgi:predicted nucleotidyltransferase
MNTSEASLANELLHQVTQRLVEAFHPEKVVLFRSYPYEHHRPGSDVDLLVIMDSQERQVERALAVLN